MKKKNILGLMGIFILVFLTFAFATTEIIDTEVEFDEGIYTNTSFTNGAVRLQDAHVENINNDSLIASWNLDQTTGAVVDSFGNNNGTNVGATRGAIGQINNSFDFTTGDSDYIDFGDVSDLDFNGTTPFSFCHWVTIDSDGNFATIGKQLSTGDQTGWVMLRNAGNDGWDFRIQNSGANQIRVTTTNDANATGTYRHTCLTYDGSQSASGVNIYVDSVNRTTNTASDTLTLSSSTSAPFNLGIRNNVSFPHDGRIDEVGVWSKVLSQSEIIELYNTQLTNFQAGTYQSKLFNINTDETWELNSTCTDCINITYEINSSGTELSCGASCTGTSADNITGKWYLNSSSALINFTFTNTSAVAEVPLPTKQNYPTTFELHKGTNLTSTNVSYLWLDDNLNITIEEFDFSPAINLTMNFTNFTEFNKIYFDYEASISGTNFSANVRLLNTSGEYETIGTLNYTPSGYETKTIDISGDTSRFNNSGVVAVNVIDSLGGSLTDLWSFDEVYLNYVPPVSYTSINNFDIKYNDFVWGTPTEEFVLMANTTFNLTTADELFIRGMGNIKKQTHTSSANVNARFILNGVNIFEGSVATLSGLGDIVSTKILLDQTYTGAIGENWLSVEVSEDAQGTINITNAEFHILVGKSNAGNNINFNISQQNFDFTSASYINVQNFSHTHIYNSTELLDIAHRFTATGTDWPMCFLNNSVTTPEYTRYLSDASDSGSSGLTFYNNITETAGVHNWLMWCSSENAETISNNVTFSSTELKDSAGNIINSIQVDNDSINVNSPLTLTAGDNHIQGKEITIQDGNELEFMGTIIVQSISGQQTPNFHIELQNGSTIRNTTQALRQLENNNDIGTINFYASLDVTTGQTYNVSLHVDVPTGESLNLTDYSIVATEMTSLDTTQGAVAPIINIDSPAVNSYNTGLTWINFTYFDANNDIDSCNITTYQGATLNTTINSSTLVNQLYDFSTHPEGVFNLSIGCNDSTGLSDTDIRQINVDNTAPVITLLTPTNASVLTSGSVTFTANVSDSFYVDTINLYGNFSGSWILENTFDATGESQVYNLSETITNGNYIWNIEACDSAGNCAFANNNFTFAMNITSVPYDFGVFGTDLTCPLNETLAFAFGYFAVIGIILLLYFLNLLVIKIPIISLFLGLAEIIVTLNFYGCTWILGTTFTLFGLIMLFYEFVLLYKQYFD